MLRKNCWLVPELQNQLFREEFSSSEYLGDQVKVKHMSISRYKEYVCQRNCCRVLKLQYQLIGHKFGPSAYFEGLVVVEK